MQELSICEWYAVSLTTSHDTREPLLGLMCLASVVRIYEAQHENSLG